MRFTHANCDAILKPQSPVDHQEELIRTVVNRSSTAVSSSAVQPPVESVEGFDQRLSDS